MPPPPPPPDSSGLVLESPYPAKKSKSSLAPHLLGNANSTKRAADDVESNTEDSETVRVAEDPDTRIERVERVVAQFSEQIADLYHLFSEIKASLNSSSSPPSTNQVQLSDFPAISATNSSKKSAITTVWSRKLSDVVKSSGAVDKLIYKPPPAKLDQTRLETLLAFGISERGATRAERNAADKQVVQDALAAIGVDKHLVVGTYHFNQSKDKPETTRPTPVRIFFALQENAFEALRKAHKLMNTEFNHVFLRRDMSKADQALDNDARKAKDRQNDIFKQNKIEGITCVLSKSKPGQLVLIDTRKEKLPVAVNGAPASAVAAPSLDSSTATAPATTSQSADQSSLSSAQPPSGTTQSPAGDTRESRSQSSSRRNDRKSTSANVVKHNNSITSSAPGTELSSKGNVVGKKKYENAQ